MTFSFNFQVDENDKSNLNGGEKQKNTKDIAIQWKKSKEHFVGDIHKEIISHLQNIETINIDEDTSVHVISSESVSNKLNHSDYSGDLAPALQGNTDLVPGQYEGGLKIWECSEDLVQYLHECKYSFEGKLVLELGCGAGLPGLFALKYGATVWFNDYNEDVLNEITIPNTLINKPDIGATSKFFSGDWQSFEDEYLSNEIKTEEQKFDLILTSETIYNEENHNKLVSIFKKFLKKDGDVLVSGKTFYFGVGGGMRQFESVLKHENLDCSQVKTFDSGVKREILKVKLKA